MFAQLTQGLAADKKARAALFLARFEMHAAQMMWRHGPGDHGMSGRPPRAAAGPEQSDERHAMAGPPDGAGSGSDTDDWFSED